MKNNHFPLLLLIVPVLINACKKENTSLSPKVYIPYFQQVKTIVQNNCTVSCHAPSNGFHDGQPIVLESDSDISGRAHSIKSAIADPISVTNKRMPPVGTLSNQDIDCIKKWEAKGGKITD